MENNQKLSPSPSSTAPSSSSSPSLYARFRAAFFGRPLVSISLLYLTINVAVAAYRARGDLPLLGFVLFTYVDLLLLFFFLIRFEGQLRAAAGVSRGQRVIWTLAGSVAGGGFCGLFLRREI